MTIFTLSKGSVDDFVVEIPSFEAFARLSLQGDLMETNGKAWQRHLNRKYYRIWTREQSPIVKVPTVKFQWV